MTEVLRSIFREVLFDTTPALAVTAASSPSTPSGLNKESHWALPPAFLPESCNQVVLPHQPSFVDSLREVLLQNPPQRLLLLPPLIAPSHLPEELRAAHPGLGLEEITLKVALEFLPGGSRMAVILPSGGFPSSIRGTSLREEVVSKATVRYVITHNHDWTELGLQLHPKFKMTILILDKIPALEEPIRFFKIPPMNQVEDVQEIVENFRHLTHKGGGTTDYGYVHREPIEPGEPYLYDRYHPDLLQKQQDMSYFGEVRPLEEIVTLVKGLHIVTDVHLLLPGDSSEGVPVLESRDIRHDGSLSTEDTRYRSNAPAEWYLQPGDICLRATLGEGKRVPVAEIKDGTALVASQNVIVLRPNPDVSQEDRELLLAYLRSDTAMAILRAYGVQLHLNFATLQNLPVPVPDEDLSLALRSLNEAAQRFDAWKEEAEQARSSLFKFTSAKDARLHLLTQGRRSRQRREAAALVDDFNHRVRTRYPHPIAYRWRTVEATHANLERYTQVLECAEIAVSYFAMMAILLARNVEGAEIMWLGEMAKRLCDTQPRGTNLGDWVAILQEVRDSKKFRHIPEGTPFYELLHLLDEEEVDESLRRLCDERNRQAHGKGPKGSSVTAHFEEAAKDLEVLLRAAEFVSEYPLRYIEQTSWDSFTAINAYTYRDLVGDHPLVPLASAQSDDINLEAGSLYLVDRRGKMHLLRPLLTRQDCPICGSRSTFLLDTYDPKADVCYLKSLEHGHTFPQAGISYAFRYVGLLLPKDSNTDWQQAGEANE